MQIPDEIGKTFLDRKSVLFIGVTFALSLYSIFWNCVNNLKIGKKITT